MAPREMTGRAPQAKQRSEQAKLGDRGEAFVVALLQEMDLEVTPTPAKPSIDAYATLHDDTTNLHFGVQVKTGQSFVKQKKTNRKHFVVKLERRDIADWQSSGQAVIVVWVDGRQESDQSSWTAYWGSAATARGGGYQDPKNITA